MGWRTKIWARLDGLDDHVSRLDRLVPPEDTFAMGVWAEMDDAERKIVQRAAYNGQAIAEPRQALVAAVLMEPQARRIRKRRPWLVGLLVVSLAAAFGLLGGDGGVGVVAIAVVAVSLPAVRLILDFGFERARGQNENRGRDVSADTTSRLE